MTFVIKLWLLTSLSVLVSGAHPDEILKNVQRVIKKEGDRHPYELKLHDGGLLAKTECSIVYRGTYIKSYSIRF